MRQYETGFVLSPGLSDEETEGFIKQMAEVVAQKKGRMVKQDVWGKRRLAYPIKRFHEGTYVFFLYEGPGDVSQELERRFKQTDTVIRFLTVLKDPQGPVPPEEEGRPAKRPPPAAAAVPAPAVASEEEK